ncbi:MAG: SRPBCC family protein [Sphingobacteriales bacterium]|nr:SRPBCC family protein [Sphingobacteriales bacterium]
MKIVRGIFMSVVALLLVAVGSTFFMDENFRVSYKHTIDASPEVVYEQLVTLKNWENWSYWRGLDDKMVITYNDIPSGVGASYSWKSDKKEVGNGSFTIERTVLNEYVQSRLKFVGQNDGFSEYIIRSTDEGTELTSALNTKTVGIVEKLMARLLMKPMMLKAFKATDEKMNAYLKANPDAGSTGKTIDSVSTKVIDSVSAKIAQDCVVINK